MTRDEAREAFKNAGLTYSILTKQSLRRLRTIVNEKLAASGLMNDTYRCTRHLAFMPGGKSFAGIKCKSFYFYGREAVSFNRDGFIGFAGWSDDTNVQPILDGFIEWVNEMAAEQQKAA